MASKLCACLHQICKWNNIGKWKTHQLTQVWGVFLFLFLEKEKGKGLKMVCLEVTNFIGMWGNLSQTSLKLQLWDLMQSEIIKFRSWYCFLIREWLAERDTLMILFSRLYCEKFFHIYNPEKKKKKISTVTVFN